MPRLSLLKGKTKEFDCEICGEHIKGRFRPVNMTGQRLDEINELLARGNVHEANAKAVSEIVSEWDICGENDKPIALDAETLHTEVPSRILSEVLSAIGEAQSPPAKKSDSSDSSF